MEIGTFCGLQAEMWTYFPSDCCTKWSQDEHGIP